MAFDLDEDELRATRKMNKADRNEIEVNDYVRTDNGEIHKVIDIEKGSIKIKSQYKEWIGLCCIVKHGKQLIDLIEVKDVIKYRINNISTTLETKGYVEGIVDISDEEMLQKIKSDKNYHILEILTKERYMTNCYKVGGEYE